MIEKIKNEARKQIVSFHKDYSLTPFEINNGYCENFAMEILSGLNLKESKDLFVIQFVNLTNTADDDWDDFFKDSIEPFNLNDTLGFERDKYLRILKEYADESHVWLVLRDGDNFINFDAESPEGVDHPFKLKTFKKFFDYFKKEETDKNLEEYLLKYKKEQDENFYKEYAYSKDNKDSECNNGLSIFDTLMLFIVIFILFFGVYFSFENTSKTRDIRSIKKGLYNILKNDENKIYIDGFMMKKGFFIKKIENNIIVEGRDIDLGTCASINLNFRKHEIDISFSKIENLCNEYIKHEPQIIYSLNKN